MTKDVADYSTMKSYLEKNNLHYFTVSPNSEKLIKSVLRHLLLPDPPAAGTSNSLENLGFNFTNVRQMTTTRTAPNGQTQVELLPLFLFILTGNLKSKEIFKLHSLNHIIIKAVIELGLALRIVTTAKTLAISGPTASNLLDVCGAVVATCIQNALKKQI
jgi:hypothetical protein